ncbi:MAG TPA: hypothetical protein VMB18_18730 [Terriglobales bacterium]|nr:hypothetical protein [Terriglobales bacterium]
MKFGNLYKSLLLGLTLLLAVGAFAANKGSMQILDPVNVNGKTLPAGEYSLQWDGTGQNVQVSILRGKKVVATAPAHVVGLDKSSQANEALVKNTDGSRSLSEVRFEGKKYALQIGEAGGMAEAGGSNR